MQSFSSFIKNIILLCKRTWINNKSFNYNKHNIITLNFLMKYLKLISVLTDNLKMIYNLNVSL